MKNNKKLKIMIFLNEAHIILNNPYQIFYISNTKNHEFRLFMLHNLKTLNPSFSLNPQSINIIIRWNLRTVIDHQPHL